VNSSELDTFLHVPTSQPSRGLVKFALRSRIRAAFFLLAISVPGALFAVYVARISFAASWGDTLDVTRILRAVELDPDNPEFHHVLGGIELLQNSNTAEAVRESRLATELNPHSAVYQLGLAQACFAAGEQACADQAFEEAVRLAPYKPQYAWEAALNYVVTERPADAVRQLKSFLQLKPAGAPEVFQLLLRTGCDPEFIWQNLVAVSRDGKLKLMFLNSLMVAGHSELTAKYWAEIVALHPTLTLDDVVPYLKGLLAAGSYRQAATVWEHMRTSGTLGDLSANDNTNKIFNGSFEQEPLEFGFDWQNQHQTYVDVDFSDPSAHSGTHALRLEFTVPRNAEYEPIFQFVSVIPDQTYLLTAYARSADITSDSGPRLRILDPKCPQCLSVSTDGITGTTAWQQLRLPFTAGTRTEVVRISVWRPHSRSFPMEISGRFWLDTVSLQAVAQPTPSSSGFTQ
jgi:tetratricopeptide (TPR) repeat protein